MIISFLSIARGFRQLFLLFLFCCGTGGFSQAQTRSISLSLGYHHHPDDFYLSTAELDSAFSPEQGLRFSGRVKYEKTFALHTQWSWHLLVEYNYRSLAYQFQTPLTGDANFQGNLEAQYIDLGAGLAQRFAVNPDLQLGWSGTVALGIPFQKDTAFNSEPVYPLRRATVYLPYLQLGGLAERVFKRTEKGYWKVGVEPVLRLFTSPLHEGTEKQGINTGWGLLFGFTYSFY